MRVHELAKELGVSSKELIERLQQLGLPVKSHMAVIPEDAIARIRSERQQLQAEPSSAAAQLAGEEPVSSPEPATPQRATA
ncbi:MAG: translation initiation factor IF-2 N-terminal domain-containing protein, partial [Kiritimatiellia bacterium]